MLLDPVVFPVFIAIVAIVILAIFFHFVPFFLWLSAKVSGVHISLIQLFLMRIRNVPPGVIVPSLIEAHKAGLKNITRDNLEAHYMTGGHVQRVVHALVSASKANIDLPFEKATAIDLAGRDVFEAVTSMLSAVEGTYALGILCTDTPDRLIAARKDAPLLLGYGEGENFIASDVTALIRHTRDIAYMDDGELAILSRSGIRVYDRQLRPVEKKHHHVDWEVDAAEKGGYAHFMLKEIMEQPAAIRKATAARIQGGRVVLQDLTMTPEQIRAMGRIYIVACGSSYHVGMVGKYNLERMLRRSVEVCLASEFRYADPIVGEGDLVIVISQSGETLDTMAALREAKKRGARILSIVNVVGSSIARESDDVLYTWAGPEIAVATTKAYSTQMAVLNLLGLYFGEVMGTVDYETYTAMVRDILALPEKLEQVLAQADQIQQIARDFAGRDDVFFIGRNLDYALSMEGSLKLKEISYIHSEAYASGELKHGTISLIEEGTPVIALSTYGPLFDKAMSNVVEVQARGANVLALTTETHRDAMAARTPRVLTVPDVEPMLLPQLGVAPLQLLAYYIALERGCDIDKPRNLAKSVTVE